MIQFYGNLPVFDETNYKGLIAVKITLNSWTDIPAVRSIDTLRIGFKGRGARTGGVFPN